MQTEVEEVRDTNRTWWPWGPAATFVLVAILLFSGLLLMLLPMLQRARVAAAAVDKTVFAMGLAGYQRDLGAYPPDDITSVGGSAEDGANEVINYYLGRRHSLGANFYGPYVVFDKKRLADTDEDGFPEYRDPWKFPAEYL